MARDATPAQRASDGKRAVTRVRRKYNVKVNSRKKLLPVEEEHVADMVVVLKLAGYSNTQMAKAIGISRGQVKEFLARPDTTEKLLLLRETLPEAALQLLQGYLIEAVQAIVDVMRTTEDDALVVKAAGEVLDRAGIPKASRQERKVESTAKTVFTDDGIVDALREASPEVQEEAAQIMESLEKLLSQSAVEEQLADS